MPSLLRNFEQPTDGYELMAIVTYSYVPQIMELLHVSHYASNREIAYTLGMDESYCAKHMKLLVSNGLVRKQRLGNETRYWLTRLGEDCGRSLHNIVLIGEVQLPFTEDPCRGCANLVEVSGHRQIPDYEECAMADEMTDEDCELCDQGKCPYFELIDLKAEDD